VLNALVGSEKFNVTVFKRKGSASTVPHSVKLVEVDYDSLENLTSALHGQDAVICNLGMSATEAQLRLIDASVAAGVKRFLPGEFGCDMHEKNLKLPVFGNKARVEAYLEEKARTSQITYTYVFNGAFLDWGITARFILDIAEYKPTIYDGGDTPFSTTTTASVGTAVVDILTHYEETKNRGVRVHDTITTQNKLLAIAKKYTPGKTWQPVHANLKDMVAHANANIAKGIYDMPTMYTYLFLATFDESYEPEFKKTDNELLGLKGLTKEEVEAVVKKCLPVN
jgi:NmrA-like family